MYMYTHTIEGEEEKYFESLSKSLGEFQGEGEEGWKLLIFRSQ